MKLAVFDFDSTLMDGETLEFLAKEIGIKTIIVTIHPDNIASKRSFSKLGAVLKATIVKNVCFSREIYTIDVQ